MGRLAAVCLSIAVAALAAGEARAQSALRLVDDWQRVIELPQAPRRIVSLAPHATELLFAAGAGARVVAVDRSSDHPAEVR
ncbi:MAG TPA: cobalamin-binding protein, partial [Quisquiliibacterium sp.]|nr:cobalamin-binding protein [Quisquiliibacterium sp.]